MLLTKHSLDILKFLSNKSFFLGASCTIIVRLTVTDAVCPLCFRMLEHGKTWCNCKDVSGLGISALGWTLLRSLYCFSNFCSQHHISRDVTNVAGQCEGGKKGSRRESRHKGFILQWLCCVRDFRVRIRENIFLAVFWSCRIYRSVSCIVELGWARLHFGSMRALLVWKIYG